MEPTKYQKKWEELNRAFVRIKKLYSNIITDEDSFQGPKDIVLNFFRVSYELKEALKKSDGIPENLRGYNGLVEQFSNSNQWISLSLDIANKEKHVHLKNGKSGKKIGTINSHVHLLDPSGNDRTEMTIEIDDKKLDCLQIAEHVKSEWEAFLSEYGLVE